MQQLILQVLQTTLFFFYQYILGESAMHSGKKYQ